MSLPNAAALRRAIRGSLPTDPVQYDTPNRELVYVPRRHGAALNVSDMLVVGERGTGKSFWARALVDPAILATARSFVGMDKLPAGLRVVRGWDGREDIADGQPTRRELQQLVVSFEPRNIWAAIYLKAVGAPSVEGDTWASRVHRIQVDPTAFSSAIRMAQLQQEKTGVFVLVLFDELDRTADDPKVRLELLRGLLQLLLDLRATRFLRAKLFVRPDMIATTEVRTFPDASKVVGSPARLDWEITDLFALAWHRLANSLGHGAIFRDFAEQSVGAAFEAGDDGYRLEESLRVDATVQRNLFHGLTGPAMGKNVKRGVPYTWLPNHLADARGIVTVRSFLIALAEAAQSDAHLEHPFALHWDALKDGVRKASVRRRLEVEEDLPWAEVALGDLKDLAIPSPRETIFERWTERDTVEVVRTKERAPALESGKEKACLYKALADAGVFGERSDGRLNVPDVYRVAYGLPLRGGVSTRRR